MTARIHSLALSSRLVHQRMTTWRYIVRVMSVQVGDVLIAAAFVDNIGIMAPTGDITLSGKRPVLEPLRGVSRKARHDR